MDESAAAQLVRFTTMARNEAIEGVAKLHDDAAKRHAEAGDAFMATYERTWAEAIRQMTSEGRSE